MEPPDPAWEQLANLAANLLSERRYEEVVRRILAVPAGVWQVVTSCCAGIELDDPDAELLAREANHFLVTHLAWPGEPADSPYCMILFVSDEFYWSSIAL